MQERFTEFVTIATVPLICTIHQHWLSWNINKHPDVLLVHVCECGHLGSYHIASRVCTKSEMAKPRTVKSELTGSYDASDHTDL